MSFIREKSANVKAGNTLALPKSTQIEIFLQAIYWCLTCICYFISHFWTKQVFSLYHFNILLGYACLPGSSGQRYKWSDWHFMERSRCPKRYFFLLVNLTPNFRCSCDSGRKLGLVHFRKDFWDCYKVYGGVGNWPIPHPRVASNDTRNNWGTHFGSSSLLAWPKFMPFIMTRNALFQIKVLSSLLQLRWAGLSEALYLVSWLLYV